MPVPPRLAGKSRVGGIPLTPRTVAFKNSRDAPPPSFLEETPPPLGVGDRRPRIRAQPFRINRTPPARTGSFRFYKIGRAHV